MVVNAKIKDANKKTVVGFANSGLPLGERSQEDINKLAIMAQESKSSSLLELFEELPSIEDLKAQKTDADLKEIKKLVEPKSTK